MNFIASILAGVVTSLFGDRIAKEIEKKEEEAKIKKRNSLIIIFCFGILLAFILK